MGLLGNLMEGSKISDVRSGSTVFADVKVNLEAASASMNKTS
jgi:hypothetical protein